MIFMRKYYLFAVVMFICSCTGHYSIDDFALVRKTDMHVHLGTIDTFFLNKAFQDNFKLITLNTEVYIEDIDKQEEIATALKTNFPEQVCYISAFSMNNWDSAYWCDSALARIKRSMNNGARGIKVWKNIGMVVKDKDSNYVMIDDPKFDTIFHYLTLHHIPVVGHCGEPRNCWLPIDKMTIRGDSSYFSRHPEYHMYCHPECPSYEKQIAARDGLLDKNPGLVFIGAHLGSLEWSIDELIRRFEKYPNFYVETAGRQSYLEMQARDNWQKVHDFLIRYSNRILYGTDLSSRENDTDTEGTKKYIHGIWMHDWQFFVSSDSMRSPQFEGAFRGMMLPKYAVDNIYFKNAERLLITNKITE